MSVYSYVAKPSLVRDDIMAVALLTYANGTPRYPQAYIAALFGVDRTYVAHLAERYNLPRRRRYAPKFTVIASWIREAQ